MIYFAANTDRAEKKGKSGPAAPSSPIPEDETLIRRIREGDRHATEELIRRYQPRTYAITFHMCGGNREEAWDLTQEAFLKALKSIGKFSGKSSFYTWFYRIVVNTCLDARRRKTRWNRLFRPWRSGNHNGEKGDVIEDFPDREEKSPLAALSGKQFGEEVRQAVDTLSEKQRLVFQLKVLHGMTISEIAQVMHSAEGTVKSHLFRATKSLRKKLKDWENI
ncbi:RNA polymerase subunit sigma-24 [Desulfonema ishimotonii]|uniref:RNA polymerase subunit sigma-24 n=1 Tax=Desulfonema ishimotonii TaxID=45657 RepID=A0A401G0Y3_9BACT|nr:sigma-70 family RNA polymerase sigma factor [Desulfonema ishimotonii]GBC62867.1 RNA polymerase subunit sigma-24 [Desulfonema ishimotonii]